MSRPHYGSQQCGQHINAEPGCWVSGLLLIRGNIKILGLGCELRVVVAGYQLIKKGHARP